MHHRRTHASHGTCGTHRGAHRCLADRAGPLAGILGVGPHCLLRFTLLALGVVVQHLRPRRPLRGAGVLQRRQWDVVSVLLARLRGKAVHAAVRLAGNAEHRGCGTGQGARGGASNCTHAPVCSPCALGRSPVVTNTAAHHRTQRQTLATRCARVHVRADNSTTVRTHARAPEVPNLSDGVDRTRDSDDLPMVDLRLPCHLCSAGMSSSSSNRPRCHRSDLPSDMGTWSRARWTLPVADSSAPDTDLTLGGSLRARLAGGYATSHRDLTPSDFVAHRGAPHELTRVL